MPRKRNDKKFQKNTGDYESKQTPRDFLSDSNMFELRGIVRMSGDVF